MLGNIGWYFTFHSVLVDIAIQRFVSFRLESATTGRKSESEMAQESMIKSQRLETEVDQLNARIKALEEENAELKEQAEMEGHTTKSVGQVSFDNEVDCHVNHVKDRLMSDPDSVSHQSSDGACHLDIDDHERQEVG